MTAQVLLSRSDLEYFIGGDNIPDTFKIEKLNATTNEVVEGWLADILSAYNPITADTYFAYYSEPSLATVFYSPYPDPALELLTLADYTIARTLKQFLCYAVWSIYIKKSNAINTNTGIVAKLNPDSERISDRQRTELSNYYQGLAERKALELQGLLTPVNRCTPANVGSGRPVIRKAQRRSPSRLGN